MFSIDRQEWHWGCRLFSEPGEQRRQLTQAWQCRSLPTPDCIIAAQIIFAPMVLGAFSLLVIGGLLDVDVSGLSRYGNNVVRGLPCRCRGRYH